MSTELRTMNADIANLRVGQTPQALKAPLPSSPRPESTATPIPPTPSLPTPSPSLVIPDAGSSSSGSGRKIIYSILAIIIVGGIIYSLISLFSGPSDTPTPTPSPSASATPRSTPTPTPTATTTSKNLPTYFPGQSSAINLKNVATAPADFRTGLLGVTPAKMAAIPLMLRLNDNTLNASSVITSLLGTAPSALPTTLGTDWIALSFGQTEQYSASGIKSDATTVRAKPVFIFEVGNATTARQALTTWEGAGLASAGTKLFGYDMTKRLVAGFAEGIYRTIPVRYWNFPYADASVDYAIVTASNNLNYLIISASRESIFFIIDQLLK